MKESLALDTTSPVAQRLWPARGLGWRLQHEMPSSQEVFELSAVTQGIAELCWTSKLTATGF